MTLTRLAHRLKDSVAMANYIRGANSNTKLKLPKPTSCATGRLESITNTNTIAVSNYYAKQPVGKVQCFGKNLFRKIMACQ